jgi:hypothetical protein
VDRIDSDGVYSPNNSVPCCATCNFMKGSLSVEEFLAKAYAIVHTHDQEPHTRRPRTVNTNAVSNNLLDKAQAGKHQQRADAMNAKPQKPQQERSSAATYLLTFALGPTKREPLSDK